MRFQDFFYTNPWMGKILGGLFGYLIAGAPGALCGILIGNFFDKQLASHLKNPLDSLKNLKNTKAQALFFEATFAIMGHIAKADGRISEREIQVATQIMEEMELAPSQRKMAQDYFNQGKNITYNTRSIVDLLKQSCHNHPGLLRLFMEIQYKAAQTDGLTIDKIASLNALFSQLGFSPLGQQPRFYQDFDFGWSDNRQNTHQQNRYNHTPSPGYTDLAQAYTLLEIDPTATKPEVKKAYRKQMSRNHPDKLIAEGLPESMIKMANDKTQKITKAYEQICTSKGW